jgi:broad specificity phosphatase PhoE
MEKSAELCPDNKNVKMILRHSIRHNIAKGEAGNDVNLMPEGKIMARRLGESLDRSIGSISSSLTPRCVDTCNEIISGYKQNYIGSKLEIIQTKLLQEPQIRDEIEAGKLFSRIGIDGIFKGLILNEKLQGMYDLDTSVKRLLDYVFSIGNNQNEVDIFCTHDFQLVMLLLFFFGINEEHYNCLLNGKWPLMLEGMFLWGSRNDFNLIWRGEDKKIKL